LPDDKKNSLKPYQIDRHKLLLLAVDYVAQHEEAYWEEFTPQDREACGGGVVQGGFFNAVKAMFDDKNVGRKALTTTSLKSRMTRATNLMLEMVAPIEVADQGDDVMVPQLERWLTSAPKPEKVEVPEFDVDELGERLKKHSLLTFRRMDATELKKK